jgi:hypothetical protein
MKLTSACLKNSFTICFPAQWAHQHTPLAIQLGGANGTPHLHLHLHLRLEVSFFCDIGGARCPAQPALTGFRAESARLELTTSPGNQPLALPIIEISFRIVFRVCQAWLFRFNAAFFRTLPPQDSSSFRSLIPINQSGPLVEQREARALRGAPASLSLP